MTRKRLKRPIITEEQFLALRYLEENGPVRVHYEQRELTAAEMDYVAPRVKRIEQLRLVLAGTSQGGAWTNEVSKKLRAEERAVRKYLLNRLLIGVTWQDENGRERYLEVGSTRSLFKVNIR